MNCKIGNVERPLLAAPRDQYIKIPGLDKTIIYNDGYDDKQISFALIVEHTISTRKERLREVSKWLYSVNKEKMIFDDESDVYYLAKINDMVEVKRNWNHSILNLKFIAEAYLFSNEIESVETENNESIFINNAGTYTALPIFYIDVSSELTRLTFTLNTQILTFEGTVSNGSKLVIDCENIEVYTLNNAVKTDASLNLDGEFLQIPIGDNEITVEIEGVATIKTEWRRRYV